MIVVVSAFWRVGLVVPLEGTGERSVCPDVTRCQDFSRNQSTMSSVSTSRWLLDRIDRPPPLPTSSCSWPRAVRVRICFRSPLGSPVVPPPPLSCSHLLPIFRIRELSIEISDDYVIHARGGWGYTSSAYSEWGISWNLTSLTS